MSDHDEEMGKGNGRSEEASEGEEEVQMDRAGVENDAGGGGAVAGQGQGRRSHLPKTLAQFKELLPPLLDYLSAGELLAVFELSKLTSRFDGPQLEQLGQSMVLDAGMQEEVERYEADAGNWETTFGRNGEGGYIELVRNWTQDMPTLEEVPLRPFSSSQLNQDPGRAFSVGDQVYKLCTEYPRSLIDIRSPAMNPVALRVLVARLEAVIRDGTKISVGTCVSEFPKYLPEYVGVMRMVGEWGCEGALKVYGYAQLDGLASPHRKPFFIVSRCGMVISGGMSANMGERGWSLGTHMAKSEAAARKEAKSGEGMYWSCADLRNPDRVALSLLNSHHVSNKAVRGANGFIWVTDGLVMRSKPAVAEKPVKRSKEELEEKFKIEEENRVRRALAGPVHEDEDVELASRQVAFTLATASSGGVDLSTDPSFAKSKPVVRRATTDEYHALGQTMSTAYSLTPKVQEQQQQKRLTKNQRAALREEVIQSMDLSSAEQQKLATIAQVKPVAAAPSAKPASTPKPRFLANVAKRGEKADLEQQNGMREREADRVAKLEAELAELRRKFGMPVVQEEAEEDGGEAKEEGGKAEMGEGGKKIGKNKGESAPSTDKSSKARLASAAKSPAGGSERPRITLKRTSRPLIAAPAASTSTANSGLASAQISRSPPSAAKTPAKRAAPAPAPSPSPFSASPLTAAPKSSTAAALPPGSPKKPPAPSAKRPWRETSESPNESTGSTLKTSQKRGRSGGSGLSEEEEADANEDEGPVAPRGEKRRLVVESDDECETGEGEGDDEDGPPTRKKKKPTEWTDEQLKRVREGRTRDPPMSVQELVKLTGHPKSSVQAKWERMPEYKRKFVNWTDKETELVRQLYAVATPAHEIAAQLGNGRTTMAVEGHLAQLRKQGKVGSIGRGKIRR